MNQPTLELVTPASVRTIAKEQEIDLNCLLDILRLRRPEGSKTEEEFVAHFLGCIPGMMKDGYGNHFIVVGDNPTTMWSCHTDTVSREGGNQNIQWEGDVLKLHNGKPGQSLGADDGAGIWLMLEMLKVSKPGLYIFHRAEECGGLGSEYFAKNHKDELTNIKRAIAFDRKGTNSVITKQRWSRTCSDVFGKALADELNKTPGMKYSIDDGGVFTDTANYDDQIPECTNLSAGYYNEHGPKETLDVAHLFRLREAVLSIDFEALPTERDPSEIDTDYGYSNWGQGYTPRSYVKKDPMEALMERRPLALAIYFEQLGWDAPSLDIKLTEIMADYYKEKYNSQSWGSTQSKPVNDDLPFDEEVVEEDVLHCDDCGDVVMRQHETAFSLEDGSECCFCFGRNTYVACEELENA